MGGNNFLYCKIWYRWPGIAAITALISMPPVAAHAQQTIVVGPGIQNTASYSQQQLDQMLAPIALYPDTLVAQILMASTYPLEVVEASRWLQQPANAALKGDRLAAALEQQPWDTSVKSLAVFPGLINMLDSNLEWTEDLGDAFLDDQSAVMDSVQRLRWRAQLAGTLRSTAQQSVLFQDQDIIIEPANPQIVYIPSYNPLVIYGNWPYPDYPPFYFSPPANVIYYDSPAVNFGIGIATIPSLWAWEHWDWKQHRINVYNRPFRHKHHHNPKQPPATVGVWSHNPDHRHGIPYRNPNMRDRFPRDSGSRVKNSQELNGKHRANSRSRPAHAAPSEPVNRNGPSGREPEKSIQGEVNPQNKPEIQNFERSPAVGVGKLPYGREFRQPEKRE